MGIKRERVSSLRDRRTEELADIKAVLGMADLDPRSGLAHQLRQEARDLEAELALLNRLFCTDCRRNACRLQVLVHSVRRDRQNVARWQSPADGPTQRLENAQRRIAIHAHFLEKLGIKV